MIPRPDVDREGPLWGNDGYCRWRRGRSAKGREPPSEPGTKRMDLYHLGGPPRFPEAMLCAPIFHNQRSATSL